MIRHLLVWAFSGTLAATLAHAQMTNVELLAMFGGRIIGAASACRINAERIRKAAEKVLVVVKANAHSDAERVSASGLFASAQKTGFEQVRSGRTTCSELHVEFSEIEVKLAKYPGTSDAVAARPPRRPVPPMGALRPEIRDPASKQ